MQKNQKIPFHGLETHRVLLTAIYLAVATWYLTWRLGTFNPDAMAFSVTLYTAEVFGFATALLHIFMTWRMTDRQIPEAEAGKTVDVFITTINESEALVRRTALAAVAMEYPHKTWILDDGDRAEMRRMAEELGCYYVARKNNVDAKAGNLNNALQHSEAEFVAVFDADHAPKRDFLTKTLGFFSDKKTAFVQTPQDFYNLDSFQHRHDRGGKHVWTEQSLFFRVIQRGKDYWNAAFFCGSCAVMRRSALNDIGGFATGTVAEDLHTSIRLHKKGYKSAYLPRTLALGLAPQQIAPFLAQRVRWGQGAMQVWRQEGIIFSRGLTLAQRLCYLASMVTYFDGWVKCVFYVAPVIVLATATLPVNALSAEFFMHFIPYFILTFWVFSELARGYGGNATIEKYNMARFAAFAWATLGLFSNKLRFRVTRKEASPTGASTASVAPQFIVMIANIMAISMGIYLYMNAVYLSPVAFYVNLGWALVNVFFSLGVVSFALNRTRFKRKEYRFLLPLSMQGNVDGKGPINGTMEDISPDGFRLVMMDRTCPAQGDIVQGNIQLPDGPWSFTARVVSRVPGKNPGEVRGVGCIFTTMDPEAKDRLSLFLYGSDLQWLVNGFSDRKPTILERFFGSHEMDAEKALPAPDPSMLMAPIVNSNTDNIVYLNRSAAA